MQRTTIRRLIILATLSICGIIVTQIYWVSNAFNLREKQLDQSIHIALQTVAEQIAAYNKSTLPIADVVNQVASDYFIVNVNDVIDVNILELYLKREFGKRNLQLDFEYGIYDCTTDKMMYGSYIRMRNTPPHEQATIVISRELPKYDKFIYYFGVSFPQKKRYLLYDMRLWIFSSSMILLLVLFFAYAMYVILAQRRLAEIQKDFVDNMTHEFQTPISTIHIAADVLLTPDIIKQPERLHRYAQIIKKEAQRLHKQVESILQASRAERIGLTLQKENLNLNELIIETVQYFQLQLKEKGREAVIQTHLPSENIIINADGSHLTNLIINLLDNAVKYSGTGPHINIRLFAHNGQLCLQVADNGPGIPEKYRRKIFHKFYRIPTGNLHNVKGFGLGLHYVQNVVKAHGWQIRLVCPPAGGSIFEVLIPNYQRI
ncbi:MAG: HAMP domain-containing sensor histidine kinase [Cytophagales bacterium]|nr:HAMP domain-containing histidine kinase [Bernardetiaceae bacterium]MDW8204708.1 HAMP domain-containing sensor histidine kinase [Cytophagales bacterium]